ncbi:helix-hairpin-helix domain-containing protein [Arthrobacter sp. NPDC056727]|uniref:helix-hairpin-helix domain-containing protein n=1 Tax=Arthrobacter sp. NPDC056727 TaxID=3345927 RepID=UPI00366A8BFF
MRWRLGIRAAALVGVLSLLAGALLWWQAAANGPVVIPLSSFTHDAAGESAGNPSDRENGGTESGSNEDGTNGDGNDADGKEGNGADSKSPAAGNVVVHVAGAVKKAGVVRLPRGSRVHQAIAAVGGGSRDADLDRLNLASLLEDGQKIYVPRRGEAAPADTSGGPPADRPGSGGTSGGTSGGGGPAGGGSPGAAGGGAGAKVNLNTATAEQLAELPKVGPVLAQRIVDWRMQQGPFKSPEELDAVDGVGPKMLETLLPLVTI